MRRTVLRALTTLALPAIASLLFASPAAAASAPKGGQGKTAAWNGDRTVPVHLIPLRDENDQLIVPTETNPLPFSARTTCGPCHDYGTIAGGWHFSAKKAAAHGRPGEPWLLADPRTGTILPLSYREWPGNYHPEALGLTSWDFTLLFGRHFPGGGPAEPTDEEVLAQPDARWNVSGKAEINCLACHNRSGRQDHSEWAKQVLRENLRWAATAAGGLGQVGGMASRLKGTWDIYDGPNPDDKEWAVAPFVKYRAAEFDAKHRMFLDLAYPPSDEKCLACHSVSPRDEAQWASDADVHSAAGLKCADCHRNDLGHGIVRGYDGEAEETGNAAAESFTCRGCHLGEDASGGKLVVPGRLGAPRPKHTGIPLVHFKRLSCTVCHSGPPLKEGFTRVRTSRANRLGIYGVADWATDVPAIVEPVYRRDGRGKIAPHRLVWPAFWAKLDGLKVAPLRPSEVEAAAGESLGSEERVAAVLIALSQAADEGETPVLVSGGFVFAPTVDGALEATELSAPEGGQASRGPALWAVRKGGAILPLVPDFDPAAEDKDPDIEAKIQGWLQALGTVAGRPGEPAAVVRKTLYRLLEGYLDISEVPADWGGISGPGWLAEGRFAPLINDFDIRTVMAKAGTGRTLTEEQVALILKALAESSGGADFAYVSGGRVFRRGQGGRLESREHPAAGPVTWPLAHNVRPAQQSLGWKGCADCHSAGSDLFFSVLRGDSPLLTDKVAKRSASSLMGLGGLYQRLFGLSFIIRPALKLVLAVCALVVGALVSLAGLIALGRAAGFLERG